MQISGVQAINVRRRRHVFFYDLVDLRRLDTPLDLAHKVSRNNYKSELVLVNLFIGTWFYGYPFDAFFVSAFTIEVQSVVDALDHIHLTFFECDSLKLFKAILNLLVELLKHHLILNHFALVGRLTHGPIIPVLSMLKEAHCCASFS